MTWDGRRRRSSWGRALVALGNQRRNPALLTRDDTPFDWASVNYNLDSALAELGNRENSPAQRLAAVNAWDNSLLVADQVFPASLVQTPRKRRDQAAAMIGRAPMPATPAPATPSPARTPG
jgi:hypothetical protein